MQSVKSAADIVAWCTHYLSIMLDVPAKRVDPDTKFSRLGVDSAMSTFFVVGLEELLDMEITPDVVFEYQTINELARYLAGRQRPSS